MITTRLPWDNDHVMLEKNALKTEKLERLRDEFAMAAMAAMIAHPDSLAVKNVDVAYEYADAMMKAREVQS